jgi:iron-sulfur cluster assembly accessory protein
MLPKVTLTPAAQKFISRIVRFAGQPAGGLRLVVSAGGCSGYNSEFSAEAAPRPGEETLEISGLLLFLPAESRLMLQGVTIDFTETATRSGLSFFNPNQASCACSTAEAAAPTPGVTHIAIGSIGRGRPTPVLAP